MKWLKLDALKMLQQSLFLSFPIFSLMISHLSFYAASSNIYFGCSQPYLSPMITYESNVNSLFKSLLDSAYLSNFNNFTICPSESSQSDVVYGLFQCRGDLSASNCKDCVASSVSQLRTNCPVSMGGTIQLEGCFVKYDDTLFFGVDDKMEMFKSCGPPIGYNSDALNSIDVGLANLITGSGQYFRSGGFKNLQVVAQCVQDLSISDCDDCLLEARGRLRSECGTSSWGNMYLGKCYIRYADRDNNNDGDNNTYDYDYDDDDDDDDRDRSKRKRKRKMKMKEVRRVAITVGATLGGVTSTVSLVITVTILYRKKKAAGSKRRRTSSLSQSLPPPPPPPPPPLLTPPPSPPRGHMCNIAGGCTCPIPLPCRDAIFGAQHEVYGNPWLR